MMNQCIKNYDINCFNTPLNNSITAYALLIIKPSVDIVNINQNSRTLGLGVLREKNNQISYMYLFVVIMI